MNSNLKATNLTLSGDQENFVREKLVKLEKLTQSLKDDGHVITVTFSHIESKDKAENISCKIDIPLKGHREIVVEKTNGSVEGAMQEAKKVAIVEIGKMKEKVNPSGIHK